MSSEYFDNSSTAIPRYCIYCKEQIQDNVVVLVNEEGIVKEYHLNCFLLEKDIDVDINRDYRR